MGAGIAEVSLQKAGHHVILKDNFTKGLSRGQDQIFNKYVICFYVTIFGVVYAEEGIRQSVCHFLTRQSNGIPLTSLLYALTSVLNV